MFTSLKGHTDRVNIREIVSVAMSGSKATCLIGEETSIVGSITHINNTYMRELSETETGYKIGALNQRRSIGINIQLNVEG